MPDINQAKKSISDAKNIYLVTSEEPEVVTSTLALFYTLRNLGKNVNLVIESLPENLNFLAPSLDFISYPKNFVLSVPNNVAKVSQVYYEKNDDALKIHLTLEGGSIKKDNIAFYFSEDKPDLVISLGIQDYKKALADKLNSFGFLLDSAVLNIDNSKNNQKFGKINLISETSLTEIVFKLASSLAVQNEKPDKGPNEPAAMPTLRALDREAAKCFLAGLLLYTQNFKTNLTAEIFQAASDFMKAGADLKETTNNLKLSAS